MPALKKAKKKASSVKAPALPVALREPEKLDIRILLEGKIVATCDNLQECYRILRTLPPGAEALHKLFGNIPRNPAQATATAEDRGAA